MTGAPRFSVLLPTHNRADVLGLAIASVLAQSESDFELLIVADGCTDGTRALVASFQDTRIRFFDLPKAPHFGYANRNRALREARGKFIAFAAHDDLLFPDHLEFMGRLLDEKGAAWGYSRPLWVSTDGIMVPFCVNLELGEERETFQRRNSIPAVCVVHTRAVLEEAGYWPEDVAQAADWVLWRRMLQSSDGAVAHCKTPTALHFSADWRRSRFASMPEVRTLLGIADSAPWWPAILRHQPVGEPEQAVIWRAMQAGGGSWVAGVREAVDLVINKVAWMAVCDLLPRMEAADAALTQAEARADAALAQAEAQANAALAQAEERANEALAQAEARADAALAEVAALRASTSWRLTAPVRALARSTGFRRHKRTSS